ncbi:MAG: hypothetical protein VX346_22125 [Planctomycetota bacterium]|nr:hypothetical protein [Planctomycetota bacterium]
MMVRTKLLAAVLVLAWVAQTGRAQVLQLPVISQFSIGTSVLVPDRGAVTLGSLSRSRYHSVHRGHPLRNLPYLGRVSGDRARSQAVRLSEVQVAVSIIDQRALDQAVLAEAARRSDSSSRQLSHAQVLAGQLASRRAGVSAARRYRSSRAAPRRPTKPTDTTLTATEELQQLLTQASQATSDGKAGAARIFYRMARKRTEDATLRRLINAQLSRLK